MLKAWASNCKSMLRDGDDLKNESVCSIYLRGQIM